MKLTRALSSTAALVTLLAIGRHASAQVAPPQAAPPPPPPMVYPQLAPPPPPPMVYPQLAPPPGAVMASSAPWQPPPAYYAPGEAPSPDGPARFRFGFDIGGGYTHFAGRLSLQGPVLNLGLRFGIQINNPWAVYLQSNGLIGGTQIGPALSWSHGIIAEYTLANILHLGLGPALAVVALDLCTGRPRPCTKPVGPAAEITGRIAATFGVSRSNRRHAFSLGLDLHPTFTDVGFLFYMTLSAGYEAF